MPRRAYHAAVDLGAGSGRVFLGAIDSEAVHLHEAHRFGYSPRRAAGHLRWDMSRLLEGLLAGLQSAAAAAAVRGGDLVSIGVDAWGVDYGLIDERGCLLEEPISYRDERTAGIMTRTFAAVPRSDIFRTTGVQFLPLNTLFQLIAHVEEGLPSGAERLLLIPDLCHHVLCGSAVGEPTNASTTQLLNIETGSWDDQLFARLGLPRGLMPDLRPAGEALGRLEPALSARLDLPQIPVIQPATHDTASAVAGTPLQPGWAYISSGTWSLVGVERNTPLVTDAVLDANFTNERGVAGTTRLLKNVMGLWILESCRHEWRAAGLDDDLPALLARAGELREVAGLIFPDAARFFNPPSMLQELQTAVSESGQRVPDDPVVLTKVVLDSLALRYASVISRLETLTGDVVEGIHIVGGGALNEYLNQATANATGRLVLAGPVEATAIGNLLMQTIASGATASIGDGRRAVAAGFPPRRFEPRSSAVWSGAAERYRELEGSGLKT
jgi:rhamnulokinase